MRVKKKIVDGRGISSYLQAIVSDWKKSIDVLRNQSRFFRSLRHREAKQDFSTAPVRALLLIWKILNSVASNQIRKSIFSSMQDSHAVLFLLAIRFPDLLFTQYPVCICDPDVDFLDASEKYEQICVKREKFMEKCFFLVRFRKLEIDGGPPGPSRFGKFSPHRGDHAEELCFVELECEFSRRYPHYVRRFENGLEANSFFANVFTIGRLPTFGTLTDGTYGFHVLCSETDLIAVDAQISRFVREVQGWC